MPLELEISVKWAHSYFSAGEGWIYVSAQGLMPPCLTHACPSLVSLMPAVIPALLWMCGYTQPQPHENQGGLSHWFVPCPDFSDSLELSFFFFFMPTRTWLVCEGVARALHTAAGTQSGAESLGNPVMHFSMAGKMNPGQAKLCLFQKLCHKLT